VILNTTPPFAPARRSLYWLAAPLTALALSACQDKQEGMPASKANAARAQMGVWCSKSLSAAADSQDFRVAGLAPLTRAKPIWGEPSPAGGWRAGQPSWGETFTGDA
jgi:hypothetical protein